MSQRWDDLKKRAGELQVKLQAAMATKAFNPDQPRDDHGRWSDSAGGSGEIGSKEKARMRRIDRVMNPDGSVNLDSTTRESGSGNYAPTPWDAKHITAYGGTDATRSGLMAAHAEFKRLDAEWNAKEHDRIMNPDSKYKSVSTDGTWKDYVAQNYPLKSALAVESATAAHENAGGKVGTTRIKTESSHGSDGTRKADLTDSLQKMIMAIDPSNIREIGKRREDILESRLADAEEMLKAGPPDEARDDHGRWSGGGGGDSGKTADGKPYTRGNVSAHMASVKAKNAQMRERKAADNRAASVHREPVMGDNFTHDLVSNIDVSEEDVTAKTTDKQLDSLASDIMGRGSYSHAQAILDEYGADEEGGGLSAKGQGVFDAVQAHIREQLGSLRGLHREMKGKR